MVKYNYNENISCLEIDPEFLKEGIEYAKKSGYTALRIKPLNKKAGQKYDLNFSPFNNNGFIREIRITDDFKIDKVLHVDCLSTLKSLKQLQLNQAIAIDLSKTPHLEGLYIKYDKKIKGLDSLTGLKDLLISSVKEENCLFLKELKAIKNLTLSGEMRELKGLEKLQALESLKITYSSKIAQGDIIGKLGRLNNLFIEKCKLLTDFSFLKGNESIKEIFIDNVDSIKFVSTMPNLEKINFWNCEDGNMEPLLKSKSLKQINFFPNKKHYSHTIEEIIEKTGAKRGRNK